MAIIGVGIYSIESGGYNVFDSHARDMYHNSRSEGMCIQYFQTLHRNEDIYELKGNLNSAALYQCMQCVTLLLILVDTGLEELYLPLLVTMQNTLYEVMGVKTHLSVSVELR